MEASDGRSDAQFEALIPNWQLDNAATRLGSQSRIQSIDQAICMALRNLSKAIHHFLNQWVSKGLDACEA